MQSDLAEGCSSIAEASTEPAALPFWLAGKSLPSVKFATALPTAVDAVVVGAGLMGVSVAYWLSRGGMEVLLLDASVPGWGASGRNAGMMLAATSAIENPELVQSVLVEEGIDADYEQVGHLALADDARIWEQFVQEAARMTGSSRSIIALSRASCEELMGMQIDARFFGGRWFRSGCVVNPARLTYGLAAAAVRRGSVIIADCAAAGIECEDDSKGLKVCTARGAIHARHVVGACGAHLAELMPEFGAVMTPIRGQMLATERMEPVFRMGMAVNFGSVYWRQAPCGTIVLGGLRGIDPDEETTGKLRVNSRIQKALDEFLPGAFPGFGPVRVARRWAGIMDCTPDDRPLIGARPKRENQWIIAGFGGHGMPAAIGAGKALAQTILTGRAPESLSRFDPARFFKEAPPC